MEPLGDGPDGACVRGDVLAPEAVAPGRGGLEDAAAVDQLQADPVDLRLDAVGPLRVVLEVAVEGVHPLPEVLLRGDVVQGQHGGRVLEGREPLRHGARDPLRGAARVVERGPGLLEGHELAVELVVLGVRQRGAV